MKKSSFLPELEKYGLIKLINKRSADTILFSDKKRKPMSKTQIFISLILTALFTGAVIAYLTSNPEIKKDPIMEEIKADTETAAGAIEDAE